MSCGHAKAVERQECEQLLQVAVEQWPRCVQLLSVFRWTQSSAHKPQLVRRRTTRTTCTTCTLGRTQSLVNKSALHLQRRTYSACVRHTSCCLGQALVLDKPYLQFICISCLFARDQNDDQIGPRRLISGPAEAASGHFNWPACVRVRLQGGPVCDCLSDCVCLQCSAFSVQCSVFLSVQTNFKQPVCGH